MCNNLAPVPRLPFHLRRPDSLGTGFVQDRRNGTRDFQQRVGRYAIGHLEVGDVIRCPPYSILKSAGSMIV